ncbi:MAG: YraN family protein [Actinomycetota bacterium]
MADSMRAALGHYGEQVAVAHLREQGFEILDRNWRCDLGELDVIARDGQCLVVCEVKTRRSLVCGHPSEAVTPHKAARLRRLTMRWLAETDLHPRQIRIDVISILRPSAGRAHIEHLRGI